MRRLMTMMSLLAMSLAEPGRVAAQVTHDRSQSGDRRRSAPTAAGPAAVVAAARLPRRAILTSPSHRSPRAHDAAATAAQDAAATCALDTRRGQCRPHRHHLQARRTAQRRRGRRSARARKGLAGIIEKNAQGPGRAQRLYRRARGRRRVRRRAALRRRARCSTRSRGSSRSIGLGRRSASISAATRTRCSCWSTTSTTREELFKRFPAAKGGSISSAGSPRPICGAAISC